MIQSKHLLVICSLLASTLVASALVACGGTGAATPRLIASYPLSPAAPQVEHRPPPTEMVVYNAYLLLEVGDTDRAAEQATALAYDHGGYLVSSRAWFQDGRKYSTLELAVPATQFDAVRRSLLQLGALISESVSGELRDYGYGGAYPPFSHITLQLQPRAARLITVDPSSWQPVRTFVRAFDVFATIFQFLVDVLIWVTVVAGPFVLAGLGLRALVRRWRAEP